MTLVQSIKKPTVQLFLTSFAILYLELALIRFIPAYVRYLGYFTNVILLGSFLGIGVGCLLTKHKRDYILFFPPLFFLLMILTRIFTFEVQITTDQVIYFKSNTENTPIESWILLPSVFLVVALVFTTLSQNLGRLLGQFKPLKAYTLDILGSIAGIIILTTGSFFALPAIVWFCLFAILFFLIHSFTRRQLVLSAVFLVISIGIIPFLDTLPTVWSPYYKISAYKPIIEQGKKITDWRLFVNNISHQDMTTFDQADEYYKIVYKAFLPQAFRQALIIGAGNGQDVNVSLKSGTPAIDAVEIDPVIADFGKKLHPDKPYADPRVRIIINDARSFLEHTQKKYDLIIFALPDSAVLATSMSNLRLESYLFTTEAFRQVKEHLTEDGVFTLYNYYRTDWLIDKIAWMLTDTFQQKPYIVRYEDNLAVFMVGPKLTMQKPSAPLKEWEGKLEYVRATDDWPFLYLKEVSLPRIYLKTLAILFAIGVVLTLIVTKGQILRQFSPAFFFLGAAFLLIETKSIVNFNLLFGSTWLVNSLVFIGILFSVLAAIWVNEKWNIKNVLIPSFLLLIALIANYGIPIEKFLLPNFFIRYGGATIFFFSPIFLANIIFSALFKRTKQAADMFGANLLGAFFGGLFEYSSLLFGYHNLILIAMLFYLLAFFFVMKQKVG